MASSLSYAIFGSPSKFLTQLHKHTTINSGQQHEEYELENTSIISVKSDSQIAQQNRDRLS